jgi:arabinan endo-1,5-alpha-L-arabinosidase
MPLSRDIQLRDPFVRPVPALRSYFLFGTTDADPWKAPGTGFDVYTGTDLDNWDRPQPAFRPQPGFRGRKNFRAPESHVCRVTQILAAGSASTGSCTSMFSAVW